MKSKFLPSSENDTTESFEAIKARLRAEDRPLVDPGPFDAHGAKFDPEYHVVNKETGEPVLNKDGTFRKRPRQPIDTTDVGGMPESENPADGLL